MREIIGFLVGFLLVVAGAEAGVRLLASELPSPEGWPSVETEVKNRQIEALSDREGSVQVVLFGSSITEAAVDPALWEESGVTAYNAAIPFGTPLALEIWAEEFVLPRLQPSVAVVGTSLWYLTQTIDEDPLRSALQSLHERRDELALSPWPWDRSELWLRRSQIKDLPSALSWKTWIESSAWTDLGYQSGYANRELEAADLDLRPSGGDPRENVLAFRRILSGLASAGITPVVLIEPAQCPPAFSYCDEADLESVAGLIVRAAQDEGALLIDARSFQADPSMFADSAHFNRKGTRAFSDYLLAELNAVLLSDG